MKKVPSKKGSVSLKAKANIKFLQYLKLSEDDVNKQSTQSFLLCKKTKLMTMIHNVSDELDTLLDKVMGFLEGLKGVDEELLKIIEQIKLELEDGKNEIFTERVGSPSRA